MITPKIQFIYIYLLFLINNIYIYIFILFYIGITEKFDFTHSLTFLVV